MKDDRENRIKVESFQSEQCKKASVQIQWLLAWLAGWTFDDQCKRFVTASTPHKVKAMRFEELDQSDNKCLTLHRRKSAIEQLKLTSLEDIHMMYV